MSGASDWVAEMRRRADEPPQRPREPLCIGEAQVGSIEPGLGEDMTRAGPPLARGDAGWHLRGNADAALDRLARWLDREGLGGRWRGEALAVTDAQGHRLACIERAAVRPLGITTRAVHLVGRAGAGRIWVQQRAFDKATDPGMWDTLAGGLVAADETIATALERETWEEAGLQVGALRGLRVLGRTLVRRPVPQGYMVEWVEMFEATVPDGLEPANRDGEVVAFACLERADIEARLREGVFTLEASLVLLAALA